MREIKFKAWDKQNERMIDLKKITPLALDAGFTVDGLFLPFTDDLVLLQFTGLTDKDGKEIYEGDILGWTWYGVGEGEGTLTHSEVYFDRYKFAVRTGSHSFGWALANAAKVIGSRFENPELLEPQTAQTEEI